MVILLWSSTILLVGLGSGALVCFMMRCRMEEAVARERSALGELRSGLIVQRQSLQRAIIDAKAEVKRAAFDEFLNEFRVEQKYYIRKSKVFFLTKQTLVMRERILFRNLPLSDWVEHAMTLEEKVGSRFSLPAPVLEALAAPWPLDAPPAVANTTLPAITAG
jgi:hypothetical protein